MASIPLTPEKEQEAKQLAARVRDAIEADVLQMARTLVSKDTSELFGKTEFDLRDLVHRIGAKMYELHLAKKKTATRAVVSSASAASKRPNSKVIARKPH